jgi:uncharacterized protein (TIGR04255 family)
MANMDERSDLGRYSKPPILEVVIELRFSEPVSAVRVKHAGERMAGRYANQAEQEQIEAVANFDTRTAEFKVVGQMVHHTSSDQTELLSISTANLAWAKRAPYDGWDAFIARVTAELGPVLKALHHPSFARLGLRYVNRIDVPYGDDGLTRYEDYINYKIEAGPFLEPSSGYTWVIRSYRPNENLHVTLQSAVVAPEISGTGAFTFDIDVAAETGIPKDVDALMLRLETMRVLKNQIFEAGITERARELYK